MVVNFIRVVSGWAITFLLGISLLVSNVSPAAAIGSTASAPSDGVETLSEIEQRSKRTSEK
mgnify:CR=1